MTMGSCRRFGTGILPFHVGSSSSDGDEMGFSSVLTDSVRQIDRTELHSKALIIMIDSAAP